MRCALQRCASRALRLAALRHACADPGSGAEDEGHVMHMSDKQIVQSVDARGDVCPVPVVKAKRALAEMAPGTLEVLVDNETSMHNLENLAKSLHFESSVEKRDEGTIAVLIDKVDREGGADASCGALVEAGPKVVAISSQTMGTGDDELGHTLMKSFVFALTQQEELPDTLLFYSGGVHLTCEGSPVLDDIKKLVDAGVEVQSCGTCLKFYNLEDQLAVGDVTNMYVIVEKQLKAGVVVRP